MPNIPVHVDQVFCVMHRAPVIGDGPGQQRLADLIIAKILYLDRVGEQIRRQFSIDEIRIADFQRFLDQRPACCWLTKPELLECYQETYAAQMRVKGMCGMCKKPRMGRPFTHAKGHFNHLCFRCLVFDLREVPSLPRHAAHDN